MPKNAQTFTKVGQNVAKLVERSGLTAHEKNLAMEVARMIVAHAGRAAVLRTNPPTPSIDKDFTESFRGAVIAAEAMRNE